MVAAIIGAGASLYGAVSNANNASKSQKQAAAAGAAQTNVDQQTLDFNKGIYNNWSQNFMPILGDIKDQAYANMQPDYARVAGDVNSAFDAQQGQAKRNMQRMGIKPTDGATSASNTQFGLGRAEALVAGDQTERHNVANQRLSNLEGVYQLGNPMLTGSMTGVNNATNTLSGAYGQQQNWNQGNANADNAAAGALVGSGLQFANKTWGMGGGYNGPSYSLGQNTSNGGIDLTQPQG